MPPDDEDAPGICRLVPLNQSKWKWVGVTRDVNLSMEPEQRLVQRVVAKDSLAFAEIYDQYAPALLGLLVRLLPTRPEADDVLQEVFLEVWRKADRFNADRGSFKVWLFVLARSRAKDFLRKKKLASLDSEPPTTSTACHLEDGETKSEVRNALSHLPESQSEPIRLSYYDGLTHEQISQRLSIPLGTTKTRIRSGINRLKHLLVSQT